jgi:hypothetical protein
MIMIMMMIIIRMYSSIAKELLNPSRVFYIVTAISCIIEKAA